MVPGTPDRGMQLCTTFFAHNQLTHHALASLAHKQLPATSTSRPLTHILHAHAAPQQGTPRRCNTSVTGAAASACKTATGAPPAPFFSFPSPQKREGGMAARAITTLSIHTPPYPGCVPISTDARCGHGRFKGLLRLWNGHIPRPTVDSRHRVSLLSS